MASFKIISSSNSRNSDLSRRNSSSASSSPSLRSQNLKHTINFNYDGAIHDYTSASDSKPSPIGFDRNSVNGGRRKSVEDLWKEIVSGEKKKTMILKEEPQEEYVMTLEDFLAKAEAMDDDNDDNDVKIEPERKRGRVMIEAIDKVTAQRQKRMIKNRESAARSRERKQAYQVELETLVEKLEQENEMLLKEIEEKTKERYKKLMEQLIPVVDVEKPKPSSSRSLSRSHSSEW